MLIELACSVTLAPAYKPGLFRHLVPPSSTAKEEMVVFIVCGGFKIFLDEYREIVRADLKRGEDSWEVVCDGEKLWVAKGRPGSTHATDAREGDSFPGQSLDEESRGFGVRK
jgi:L-serine/L-threonine ammonia-lyase